MASVNVPLTIRTRSTPPSTSHGLVLIISSDGPDTMGYQGCFALVAGRLSDIYGLRKALIVGMCWYSTFIFISAFMPVRFGPLIYCNS